MVAVLQAVTGGISLTILRSSIPQTADRILLTTITYDASSSAPIQTFPVPAEITDYGIDTGIVIFRVESNWGGDFTCLYRVSFKTARALFQPQQTDGRVPFI